MEQEWQLKPLEEGVHAPRRYWLSPHSTLEHVWQSSSLAPPLAE